MEDETEDSGQEKKFIPPNLDYITHNRSLTGSAHGDIVDGEEPGVKVYSVPSTEVKADSAKEQPAEKLDYTKRPARNGWF